MSVHLFPPESLRHEIDGLRRSLLELLEVVQDISQDVSDALTLQHIGDDFSRSHVELIVSLQCSVKRLQQLTIRLETKTSASK